MATSATESISLVVKETGQVSAYSMTTGKQVWTQHLMALMEHLSILTTPSAELKETFTGDNFLVFGFGGDIWSLNMLTAHSTGTPTQPKSPATRN